MTTKEGNMYVQKFRKKPVVIEAMRLTSSTAQFHAVYKWVERHTLGSFELLDVIEGRKPYPESGVTLDPRNEQLIISTLEGLHWVHVGDWVIRGVAGEFYPCKNDIFEATYELVGSDNRPDQTKEDKNMIYNTEDDLHTLLNNLTDGEHVKATWVYYDYTIAVEGPVRVCDRSVRCERYIRLDDGAINNSLISLEVTRDEEVTITRDDEKALHALLDSLEDGETITAEWRNRDGSMTLTGPVQASGLHREVDGYHYGALRRHSGPLHPALRSITVRRPVVQRWERDGDE